MVTMQNSEVVSDKHRNVMISSEKYNNNNNNNNNDESDTTEINNLIYAVATIITETMNQTSKRCKNRRNENFLKIRMQRQISNWRKEISIFAETGTGSDNGNLNNNERKIFQKYTDKSQESNTADKETEEESAIKRPKIQDMEKEKPSISRIRCSKKTPKNFTETWAKGI